MAEHIYGIAVGTGAHLAISGRRRKFRHICQPVVINGGIFIVSPRRRAGGGGGAISGRKPIERIVPPLLWLLNLIANQEIASGWWRHFLHPFPSPINVR